MSATRASDSPAPRGLRDVLRSWLHAWSTPTRPSSEALPTDSAGPRAHDYGRVRMLVADDNPVNLMVMSALMESRGFVPLPASDGAEAVALACELDFDLILMDLQMPILDGLGAISAIRRFEIDRSRRAVPVVAYSNVSQGRGILSMHGMNGSLSKPYADQELEDCLVRWCPTYRPAPTMPGLARGHSGLKAAAGNTDSAQAARR